MTKKKAPRHRADAEGAGRGVFGDRGHPTRNAGRSQLVAGPGQRPVPAVDPTTALLRALQELGPLSGRPAPRPAPPRLSCEEAELEALWRGAAEAFRTRRTGGRR